MLSSSTSVTKPLDITEENLQCHHLLFNKDVTSSIYDSDRDCFKLEATKLSFRRVKLNGIIVAQKSLLSNSNSEQEYNIWLDDGTSVIRVIIPKQVLKRANAEHLITSYNVTLFGKVELNNLQHVILCGGFRIDDNDASEMYHWIRAIQERPTKKSSIAAQNMFLTLSSLPSPNRLLKENFLQSPIGEGNNSNRFLWSPDHAFATSTPIRAVQESPLKQRSDRVISSVTPTRYREEEEEDEFDDEDEFGDFGSADLIALEKDALLMTSQMNKRKFDLADME